MIYAILPAGGRGLRFCRDIPKQFCEIHGTPIISKTVDTFESTRQIDKIIIACHKEWIDYAIRILRPFTKVTVIEGGENRNQSIENAIEYIEKTAGIQNGDIVVTHDAVRPFVTKEIILSSILEAEKTGASVAAIPSPDTVIQVQSGIVTAVPDRSNLWLVQTPQTFNLKSLSDIFKTLSPDEKEKYTDLSGIFVSRGKKVSVVLGGSENKKITFPGDVGK